MPDKDEQPVDAERTPEKAHETRATQEIDHPSAEHSDDHASAAFPNESSDNVESRKDSCGGVEEVRANDEAATPGKAQASSADSPFDDSDGKKEKAKEKSLGKMVLRWLLIILCAIGLSYLIRFFVITPYEIPSPSMYDTISIGDRVMSERLSYYVSDPKPGQIVTFQDPDSENSRTLIKRVIATEGQEIDLIDGAVYVDGEKIDEPYIGSEKTYPLHDTLDDMEITYPYMIPEGHLWVMGDNRDDSADSRYFGAVDVDTVSGHAFLRYWPLSEFGLLE